MIGPLRQQRVGTRAGFTLVELLVVVAILVTLVAVTVPMMRPILEGREIREAARQIDAFLGAAQARAMSRGRPVGVMFHQQPGNRGASFQMSMAEVPLPYSGDTVNARAVIQGWSARLTESWSAMMLVTPGDFIKFNYRGPLYIIDTVTQNAADPSVTFFHNSAPPPLALQGNPGMPYQIFRKPQRTPAAPLEIPTPAVVDFFDSGEGAEGVGVPRFIDTNYQWPAAAGMNNQPSAAGLAKRESVIIMFSPSGRVDRIFVRGASSVPLAPIHLLVGRTDKMGMSNLRDPHSLWVSIGNRTGRITTSPNKSVLSPGGGNMSAEISVPSPDNGGPLPTRNDVFAAREFALQSQGMGGQ